MGENILDGVSVVICNSLFKVLNIRKPVWKCTMLLSYYAVAKIKYLKKCAVLLIRYWLGMLLMFSLLLKHYSDILLLFFRYPDF